MLNLVHFKSQMISRENRRKHKRWRVIQPILTIVQSISIAGSMIYHYFQSDTIVGLQWGFIRVIYLFVTIIAYVLWLVSRIQLGSNLTFAAKAHTSFVKTGVYAFVSNPIYVFGTVTLTFYILLLNRPALLWVLFILVPFQWVRAVQERKVLRKKFGDAYEDYIETVWI